MKLRGPSTALALVPIALGLLLPGRARSAAEEPPSVDLAHLSVAADGATAPLVAGGTAELTLDPRLQQGALRLLDRARPFAGAIVAIHVPSGRLLVWVEKIAHGDASLLKRTLPSASVFKIVTTAALLETGRVTPASEVCISGGMRSIERRHLEAPRAGKILCAPFGQALGHSRNAAYAQLVTRHLTRTDLELRANLFGFNADVPFDVPVRLGNLELPYGDLELARTAAGFENVTLSPLGAAYLAEQVASGGEKRRLHVVARTQNFSAPARGRVLGSSMRPWTARQLTRMMEVTIQGGTSYEAFADDNGQSVLKDIRVAGKTGTLQPTPSSPTTSWFVGFAPSRRPEIALAVLLSNPPVWHEKANEVARDVLLTYFAGKGRRNLDDPLAASLGAR